MKKVILLKPLNGAEIGSEAEYSDADFARLEKLGAVKAKPRAKNKAKSPPKNKSK